jgi:hypothetical protein
MKHLKKFEELDPSTYRRAGMLLKGKSQETRGRKLIDYAGEKEHGFYGVRVLVGKSEIYQFTDKEGNDLSSEVFVTDPKCDITLGDGEIKDAESLVREWKEGKSTLSFKLDFSFKVSEKSQQSLIDAKNARTDFWLNRIINGNAINRLNLFSLTIFISDWLDGIVEWNTDQDTGESLIGTSEEHDVYDMFKNSFYNSLYFLKPNKPTNDVVGGVFADRKSALKFKRELPKMIEPHADIIFDIFSIIGADSEDYEKTMEKIKSISLNGLYDENCETAHSNLSRKWFNL